ncbi:MAG: J domain-containing protein [Patescibacteria group bacterium]
MVIANMPASQEQQPSQEPREVPQQEQLSPEDRERQIEEMREEDEQISQAQVLLSAGELGQLHVELEAIEDNYEAALELAPEGQTPATSPEEFAQAATERWKDSHGIDEGVELSVSASVDVATAQGGGEAADTAAEQIMGTPNIETPDVQAKVELNVEVPKPAGAELFEDDFWDQALEGTEEAAVEAAAESEAEQVGETLEEQPPEAQTEQTVEVPRPESVKSGPSPERAKLSEEREKDTERLYAASTPYEILNVPPDASDSQIKKAYKKLSRVYHPDLGGDATSFKLVNIGFEYLSDPVKRAKFDQGNTSSFDRQINGEKAASAAAEASPEPTPAPESRQLTGEVTEPVEPVPEDRQLSDKAVEVQEPVAAAQQLEDKTEQQPVSEDMFDEAAWDEATEKYDQPTEAEEAFFEKPKAEKSKYTGAELFDDSTWDEALEKYDQPTEVEEAFHEQVRAEEAAAAQAEQQPESQQVEQQTAAQQIEAAKKKRKRQDAGRTPEKMAPVQRGLFGKLYDAWYNYAGKDYLKPTEDTMDFLLGEEANKKEKKP